MNFFHSTETRWFFRESEPAFQSLKQAFLGLPHDNLQEQNTRNDYYYRMPQSPTFGIKLRMEGGGKMETKEQTEELGVQPFGKWGSGRVQEWVKWSVPVQPELSVFEEEAFRQNWVLVKKKRWLRMYEGKMDEEGKIKLSPAEKGKYLDAGCGVEWTEVQAAGRRWGTLGLEAFGEKSLRRKILKEAMERLAEIGKWPELPPDNSGSYYAWLARLFGKATA